MRDLATLPKAELHIHLEGCARPATVRALADRNGVAIPEGLQPDDTWRFADFLHFIDQYSATCALMTKVEDFHRLAYEACEDLASTGVLYAEAVFSPANHDRRHGWYDPIEAVLDGLAAGERDFGATVRLTPDIVRDFGLEHAERTLEVAMKLMDRGVVGLNCAGSERTGIEPFAPIFRRAKDAGLRSVPHAGEWAGPQNVWDTIAAYSPDRIGHGVRSIEDPRLVETLVDSQLPLEVSPTSNIATGVYTSLNDHPFERLRAAGVVVTLNSDDPGMFGPWLTQVYEAAREQWSYSDEQLADIARTGVRVSFADDETKTRLEQGIDDWLDRAMAERGSDGRR